MKKYIYLIFIIFINFNCFSQFVPAIASYANEDKIDKIISQNISLKMQFKVIICQYADSVCENSKSILLIQKDKKINYWIIKNDNVLKFGNLESDSIFCYKNYMKTGVIKKEHTLYFVPPLICSNLIIYQDNRVRFYFEFEEAPYTYISQENLVKYRKEWLEIIRRELKPILEYE